MSLLKKIRDSKTIKSALLGAAMLTSSYMMDSGLNTAYAAGQEKDKVEVGEEINYTKYDTLEGIFPEEELTAKNHDQKIKEAEKCFVAYIIPKGENVSGGIEFLDALQERYEKEGVKFYRANINKLDKNQLSQIIKLNEKDYFPTIFYYENGDYVDRIRGSPTRSKESFDKWLNLITTDFNKIIYGENNR